MSFLHHSKCALAKTEKKTICQAAEMYGHSQDCGNNSSEYSCEISLCSKHWAEFCKDNERNPSTSQCEHVNKKFNKKKY